MSNVYHDPRLHAQMKALRAVCKGHPQVAAELAKLETMLQYYDRVISRSDARNAQAAEQALAEGNHERASTLAHLCWSSVVRDSIISRVRLPQDSNYSSRLAENATMGREVVV